MIRALTYPEPLGPPRPVAGYLYFTLKSIYIHHESSGSAATSTTSLFVFLKKTKSASTKSEHAYYKYRQYAVFARVICALFFSILAAEKGGCVKYADFFFVEVLIWVLF
jgi:hypothetical protein